MAPEWALGDPSPHSCTICFPGPSVTCQDPTRSCSGTERLCEASSARRSPGASSGHRRPLRTSSAATWRRSPRWAWLGGGETKRASVPAAPASRLSSQFFDSISRPLMPRSLGEEKGSSLCFPRRGLISANGAKWEEMTWLLLGSACQDNPQQRPTQS